MQLNHDITTYFYPLDNIFAARSELARFKQTRWVSGYIATFCHVSIRILNIKDSEILDDIMLSSNKRTL